MQNEYGQHARNTCECLMVILICLFGIQPIKRLPDMYTEKRILKS